MSLCHFTSILSSMNRYKKLLGVLELEFKTFFLYGHPLMLGSHSYLNQVLRKSNITEHPNLNNFQLQSYIFQ